MKSEGPTILFLMETKLDVREMELLRVKLRFKYCFAVPSLRRSGGLAVLWNDPAQITIRNFTHNHIDSHIQLLGGICWRFTGFLAILRVIENANLGSFWKNCIALIICHGCAWETLTRLCQWRKDQERYWVLQGACRTLGKLLTGVA